MDFQLLSTWNKTSNAIFVVVAVAAVVVVVASVAVAGVHYGDVIMSAMASRMTGISIVCSTVCLCADQRKSSKTLAFVRGIHRQPVDSPHKGPVKRKLFPFYDVIMSSSSSSNNVRLPNFVSTLISSFANNDPVWRHLYQKGTLNQTSRQRGSFTNCCWYQW